MAKRIFHVALSVTNRTHEWQCVEKALKKLFRPSVFELSSRHPSVPVIGITPSMGILDKLPGLGDSLGHIGSNAVYILQENTVVDVAISTIAGPSTDKITGGLQSHYHARSILIEAIRSKSGEILRLRAHASTFVMPYDSTTGCSRDQDERGRKTVIRGVIEGWREQSRKYEGILKQLELV